MKIEEVTAYVTNDGRLYIDRLSAVRAETRRDLKQFFIENGCNEGQAEKLADRAHELAEMTSYLWEELKSLPQATGVRDG